MRVLFVTPSLSAVWGGVATAIHELAPYLVKHGIAVKIYTTEGHRTGTPDLKPSGVTITSYPTDFLARIWPGHSFRLQNALPDSLADFDLVHIHELWHYPAYLAAREAIRRSKPYVVTIHGELEPWALKYRGLKKQIYACLIQKRHLNSATVIHCLTEAESAQVRQFGATAPTMVIPNGISPKSWDPSNSKFELSRKYPHLDDKLIILFLGRIHQKKGLDLLIAAYQEIVQKYRDEVRLVIAGPDDGYEPELIRLIHEAGIRDQVLTVGPVTGRDKHILLEAAAVFALPSYSEGFSVAVLEAMSSGTPVIISEQCHFPEVGENKAGIVISTNVDQVYNALDKLLSNSELRRQFGENGRKLVYERYTWDEIARQIADLYRSLVL